MYAVNSASVNGCAIMTSERNIAGFFPPLCVSDGAKKKAKWTPEEEEELRRVYEEYKDSGGDSFFTFV